ncbi:unnamed protein product [Ranitomeya imitator]|uniref:Tyr recombinase domain-containing protein n=1 Tax=Ranitomeya imitator TaxID=111125 RepID=A0ABN9LTH2_9NEOB|nr:unnamed protein product [Ranitomeya imitator]
MIQARKPSSSRIYYRTWKAYFRWCESNRVPPMFFSLPSLLAFLQAGLDSGLALSSLKGQVSALSILFQKTLASRPQVKTFFQGVAHAVPPYRAPVEAWDLNLVLDVLKVSPFEPLREIPLSVLSWKVAFLVAITSIRRVSELAALSCRPPFLVIHQDKVVFRTPPSFLPKVVSTFHLNEDIVLPSFCPAPTHPLERSLNKLDLVRAVRIYLDRTSSFRKTDSFFVIPDGTRRGQPASKATIARWIRMAILEAYRVKNRVPPPGIKAHSTRAVSASWAVHHRASALQLCKAATWSSIHTFAKFYKVHTYASADASLGRRILQAAVNLEVAQRLPLVKVCNVENFSTSHYHLPEAYVDREMDTEQTDARSAAVEEEKRLNALQQEEDRERREQMEKAVLRGSHALKMVQLTQDRDRLMKDLEQMQQDDLSRRRQIVAKMPQQLFEPAYRRAEIREDWQRELESAFEDMYTRNAKIRGDMVLQLKPQPLPDPSVTSVDEDLDLTAEPEAVSGVERLSGGTEDVSSVEEQHETGESQSKKVLKRLLNRIRTQKDEWNAKAETSDEASDTLESGSLPIHQEAADVIQEAKHKSAIDSNEVTDNTMEELERQKREQLELIRKLEDERESLKAEFHRMREGEQRSSVTAKEEEPEPAVVDGKPKESASTVFQLNTSAESLHIQMIREYQQRLIEQNRLHQQSLDDARKRLQEYQLLLKNRYPHLSTSYKESPGRGEESTRGAQILQTKSSENDRPYTAPSPPALLSSSAQSPTIEKQPQGLVSAQQISPRNGSQTLEPAPSSASDKLRTESPVSVDSSHPHLFGGRSPQGLLSHSPNEARVTVTGSEKLSSASSPGEHDSSSGTSYLPLPRALSLGLPETDFSEPNISFMFPEEQVNRRCPPLLEDFSNVQEFRERLLSSAAEIRNQQDHLKEMQIQLDEQRESLLSKQKSQEQHLLHKQKELEEQIQRHQESLEKLLGPAEPGEGAVPADLTVVPERERYQFMSALLEALDEEEEKEVHSVVTSK